MSLIVARKEEGKIFIVSDTKLTLPNGLDFNKGLWLDSQDNVIKSTIISSSCCISFAGKVLFGEEVISQINPELPISNITKQLLDKHLESEQMTEFICCKIEQNRSLIYEIKNGKLIETEVSWIGSQPAFNRFQQRILGQPTNFKGSFITISSAENGQLINQMSEALDDIIQDETLPEVAGFKVRVIQKANRFEYDGYLDSYFTQEQLILREPQFITHGNAAQGAYTINFFNSQKTFNYVGLHVKQGNFGLIYSRYNNGFLRPKLFNDIDELDFLDIAESEYQLSIYGITQDPYIKYGKLGKQLFEQKDYSRAITSFDKGLKHLYGKQKAQFFFNKAICLIHQHQIEKAIEIFNEAIKLNPLHQPEATKIIQDVFKNGVRKN